MGLLTIIVFVDVWGSVNLLNILTNRDFEMFLR